MNKRCAFLLPLRTTAHTWRLTALLLAGCIAWSQPAWADLEKGMTALERKDYATALKELLPEAERGHPQAQNVIGSMYHEGLGVPKDQVQAVRWIRMAAEQGFADAQNALGNLYYVGIGVPKDYVEAVKWVRKAANQGHAVAQYGLGFMYQSGFGVSLDINEAIFWFRKAAQQGLPVAQFNLGGVYASGQHLSPNYKEAAAWYRMAAEQGFAPAQFFLGAIYRGRPGVPRDDQETLKWFRKAAEQGLVDAQVQLSLFLVHYSYSVSEADRDAISRESRKWLEKAAVLGHAGAQFLLGGMYDLPSAMQDKVLAYAIFTIASRSGLEEAQQRKDALAAILTAEQIAQGQKLATDWRPGMPLTNGRSLEESLDAVERADRKR